MTATAQTPCRSTAGQPATHKHCKCANRKVAHLQGHWLLARLGKKVLRPGGRQLTQRLLRALAIEPADEVIEFAPGLGFTARLVLKNHPASYIGVERDDAAARKVHSRLATAGDRRTARRVICGEAAVTGLPDQCATVVLGEAMLTMQRSEDKHRIVAEVARLLKPGGRYGIHEMALTPAGSVPERRIELARSLASAIHHGVAPLPGAEWRELLSAHGLKVVTEQRLPMRLLEPLRLVRDEGLFGAIRFLSNLLRDREARARVFKMRAAFRRHAADMEAIMLVAEKVKE